MENSVASEIYFFNKTERDVGMDPKISQFREKQHLYSVWFSFLNYSCSLPKDLYYDEDAADNDKKDEEAAKKKANRPSE